MQNVINNTTEIIERLKQARGHEKDADLARDLNVPPKKLGVWKLRNTVPLKELTTFCRRFGYVLEWALTGEGKIKKPEVSEVGESETSFESRRSFDRVTKKIELLLTDMNEEQKRDILKYVEEKKLLAELKAEKQGRKAG